MLKLSSVLFDTSTITLREADAVTRGYARTGRSVESPGVQGAPCHAEIAHSLEQLLALDTRQMRARRVRALGYGVSATALAYLAFCFVAGLYLAPLATAALVVLGIGGFAVGCGGVIRAKRLVADRHAIVRGLYAQGLRVVGRSVVTNVPHPTTLAVCRA